MTKAGVEDKDLVIDILMQSFDANPSVNYLLKQDHSRLRRMRAMMEYSYAVCKAFGEVLITEDRKGCALIVYPERKKTTWRSIVWDIQLIVRCLGFTNLVKALRKEGALKRLYPASPYTYIWFLGVHPSAQQQGIGSRLLKDILQQQHSRTVYLETSVVRNLAWYQKAGLEIYQELDFGYRIYCFRSKAEKA